MKARFKFLVLLSIVAWACDDNTPTCIPKDVVHDCICDQGDHGRRVCADDGLTFGKCECEVGGGGAAGSAGTTSAGGSSTGGASPTGGSPTTAGEGGAPN
jgi:hypothetical protein